MRKPENTFIDAIHRHLAPSLHREKMNNPYSSGTPDVWYSGVAGDLWLEYKFLPRVPQRGTVTPLKLLSPLQLRWLNERHTEGRTVGVCIGCPTGGLILRNKRWEETFPARDYAKQLCTRKELAEQIAQLTMV